MEVEEDEKHSEPACPWEAAHAAAAFITPDPSLRLRLLLQCKVMLFGLCSVFFKNKEPVFYILN